MPKRQTVAINTQKVIEIADANDWSSAAIARKIGKHDRWLSEVKRNRNLPSPEEAARMCAILNVMPEDILIEQEDIETVSALIKEEQQKSPPPDGDGLTKEDMRHLAAFHKADENTKAAIRLLLAQYEEDTV